jgi:glutaconate CoA-transferase subunit B
MRQSVRSFVGKLDFLTSLGHGRTGTERAAAGVKTKGPTLAISDLCILEPHPETKEFVVQMLHPGVTRDQVRENTGWEIRFSEIVEETPPPNRMELEALRELNERTAAAHGAMVGD